MVVASAEASKTAGNAAFKAQNYPLALSHYSTAIQLDPSVSTYPLNRSLVYLKLNDYKSALRDADTAISLDGGINLKALFRRGLARKGLGKLQLAKKDFEDAIEQGAGQDVRNELEQLNQLLLKSETNPTTTTTTTTTTATDQKPSVQSKADRLRAAISSSSPSSTTNSAPTPQATSSSNKNESSTSQPPIRNGSTNEKSREEEVDGFGMKAVSTRKLKPTSKPPPPRMGYVIESNLDPTPLPTTPTRETTQTSTAPAPAPSSSSSFAAKKLSRQTRQTSPFTLPSPSSSSASSSLRSPPPAVVSSASSSSSSPETTKSIPSTTIPLKPSSKPSPSTSNLSLTSLESHLLLLPPNSPSRIKLLKTLDPRPSKLVSFVGDSLTPDLLSLILSELSLNFSSSFDSQEEEEGAEVEEKEEGEGNSSTTTDGWMFELLEGLSQCRRFETSRMLLSDQEVEIVGKVFEREKKRVEKVRKEWGV
ncbi:hypothetical protein JCM5350_005001 [Sporobolomyces pararoseus]